MKKVILALIAISMFNSCKKEESSNSLTDEIIGTWHLHETNTTIFDGQTTSYEDDYTFIATNQSTYSIVRPGQPDLVSTWTVSVNENTFFSMNQSQSDPTYYYTIAFDILSHSSTYLHFSKTQPYNTVSPTTGLNITGTSIRDWVFTK